jgi:hypothetical protein
MADDTTAPAPAASPDVLAQLAPYLALLQQGQAQPARDDTPVERSWVSKVGEALGGPFLLPGMTPAEKEVAGRAALSHFGTGLLNASGNLQGGTIFTALGRGFDAAERGALGAQQFDASTLAAQQEYAQKQQELRISAIKEALPLLTLQQQMQQAQTARQLAGSGATAAAPVAGGTNIATGGSIAAPTYEGAIAGHEGAGKNPNSSATGVGQFLDSTWQGFTAANPDLFKGMTSAQVQAARNDPTIGAKAITWLAQQNADALVKQGVTPSGQSLGIAHYLGAGPTVAIMGAPDSAPVKGFVSDAAVKANPELATMTAGQLRQRYANTPSPGFLGTATAEKTPAPYQVAAAGSAVPPPPGGAPAAPTTDLTGPRPLPPTGPGAGVATPASIANTPVQTAQAQPPAVATAVAPAPQTTPTPPPSPYPDIKAGEGLIRHPGTFADFYASQHVPPPASEDFNPNLSPAQQAAYDLQRRQISTLPIAEQPKAYADLTATIRDATQAKAEAAAKAQTAYTTAERDKIQARYDQAVTGYTTAAQSQLTSAQKLAEINAQAGATERTAALNPINTEAAASAHRLDDLQVLKGFSNNLGDPTFLTSQKIGGKSLADIISGAGLGSQALQDKAGQAQAFHAAALSIVRDLRMGGSAAGEPRSNQDLTFITSMVPSEMQSPATRNAIISYIEQVNQRRMEYASEVGRLVNTPQFSNNVGGAMLAARQGMKDIVQTVPEEVATGGGDIGKRRLDWFRKNVQPGTFYRAPNGRMQVWHGVPGDPDYTP